MNLYLRLIYSIVISLWQGRAKLHEEQELKFRTWPHDLDLNFHMNNGRYLTLMDLGRVQLMIRLGLFGSIVKNRWMPVIGAVHMSFRKSLAPFQSFKLHTRIIAWDEKWIYIEQRFLSHGQVMAVGIVKGLIRHKKGNIPISELMKIISAENEKSPAIPHYFGK